MAALEYEPHEMTETAATPDRPPDDEALIAWLADHDELCPACRYELRGLATTRCPECDSRLSLGVSSPDIRFGPWLVSVISFALGLGFDAVVCVMFAAVFAFAVVLRGNPGPPASVYVLPGSLLVLGLACLAGIVALVRLRHRWLRLVPRTQWAVSGAVFVGVGAVHLGVAIVFIVLN